MNYILLQANFVQAAISGLVSLAKNYSEHRKSVQGYNETYKILIKMSDKDLRDIGICRGDIPAVAAGDTTRRGNVQ
jgi:uncharacterized protein YjiS (DUF1127 family)|tara:strand:- start:1622 stop:1849 length:228 start_codon:yes stop_codon:yes gene_type:complete